MGDGRIPKGGGKGTTRRPTIFEFSDGRLVRVAIEWTGRFGVRGEISDALERPAQMEERLELMPRWLQQPYGWLADARQPCCRLASLGYRSRYTISVAVPDPARWSWFPLSCVVLGVLVIDGLHRGYRFWQIDGCLDGGGRWNYQEGHCER